MSKYIKLEDAFSVCQEKQIIRNGDSIGVRYPTPEEFMNDLSDLPTIEVSEDCISREWVLEKIDECYGETEYACNLAVALEREVKSAPSVVPSRAEGEWITKTVKKLCAPDCWYPGIFAIEGSWNEEEGSWLEERDGFCSECGEQDEHYNSHNYCPNCGAKMKGAK